MIGTTLVLVALALASLWLYSKRRLNYWAERGVQTPPYVPVLGHVHKLFSSKEGRWVFDTEVYKKYGGSHISGLYEMFKPILMVGDPELLRSIFVKDFDHFIDRRSLTSYNKDEEIINRMLSLENGEAWKNLRAIMTPTFTSGKMRGMFHLVCDKADALVDFCLMEASKKPSVDVKDTFGRFTMDTIASCAFGIESNSLVNNEAIFAKQAATFFDMPPSQFIKFALTGAFPFISKALKLRIFAPATAFFKEVADETIAARRNGQKRGDFLDLLLDTRSEISLKNTSKKALDDVAIAAQSVLFIVAGYDTTASTLAFASHLLSKHPEEQQRLRQEIQTVVQENGGLTYQGIMEAKLLDACLMETLRLFPPISATERVCTQTYQIPETNVTLQPGSLVTIPIWSIHHDEQYWPEPEVFNPDRFLPENKANIRHYTHLPFGAGPRNCIAMRFALMETKVALAKMLLAAEMKVAPGYEELQLSTGPQVLRPVGGVHLVLTPLREE